MIANILSSMTMAIVLAWIFSSLLKSVGAIVGVLVAVALEVIFGEIIPKSLGAERAEKILIRLHWFLRII